VRRESLGLRKQRGQEKKPWRPRVLKGAVKEDREQKDGKIEEDWGEKRMNEEDCDESCSYECEKREEQEAPEEPKNRRMDGYMRDLRVRYRGNREETQQGATRTRVVEDTQNSNPAPARDSALMAFVPRTQSPQLQNRLLCTRVKILRHRMCELFQYKSVRCIEIIYRDIPLLYLTKPDQ
jgi:hypothetical protein